jgi:hypothetical protein
LPSGVAPISRDADWLPAIEQFGEGIFVHFDEVAIGEWMRKGPTVLRNQKFLAGYGHWQRRFPGEAPSYPGAPYVLLHSISHALMAEIALDCGYPASSLKERVYALSSSRGANDIDRCGVLIYTASAGAQGTLGGLVATAPRLRIFLKALWIVSGFVQTIRCVPITNRTTEVAIGRPTGLRAMDAY